MISPTKTLLLLSLVITLGASSFKTHYSLSIHPEEQLWISSLSDTVRGVTFESFQKLTSSLDTLPLAMRKAWKLWKTEKWDKLETYFEKNDLNGQYPPADGFISVDTIVLKDDTRIDRYGSLWGTFVAPTGTPFKERALPASSKSRTYYKFEVTKDIPNVLKGKAIPWFSMPGEGIQFLLPQSIKSLVKDGYIAILDSIVPTKKIDKYGE